MDSLRTFKVIYQFYSRFAWIYFLLVSANCSTEFYLTSVF